MTGCPVIGPQDSIGATHAHGTCPPIAGPGDVMRPAGSKSTACLVLEDGTVLAGRGFGASGEVTAELCFNTAMTGYQEILTDPSYAEQIITFTFPHIGIVGTNSADTEMIACDAPTPARGLVIREAPPLLPSSWRAQENLESWLAARNIIGICDVDTRALTAKIRDSGLMRATLSHDSSGMFERARMARAAREWAGLEGTELAAQVSHAPGLEWHRGVYDLAHGKAPEITACDGHVVALDFGVKTNNLRLLRAQGCRVTQVPARSTADEILALEPDGVFLSNGPGDPAATAHYAVPTIRALLARGIPLFGICLGHQLLALALGGKTRKMHMGHHGANHPVRHMESGKVLVTSMNHGFTVEAGSLPGAVEQTYISLFDKSNCGLRLKDRPVFSVQFHPEASPGPRDNIDVFADFARLVRAHAHTPGPDSLQARPGL